MSIQFFETVMGRRFFESQLPQLIKGVNRLAAAIEAANNKSAASEKGAEVNSAQSRTESLKNLVEFATSHDLTLVTARETLRLGFVTHCAKYDLHSSSAEFSADLWAVWSAIHSAHANLFYGHDMSLIMFRGIDDFKAWICERVRCCEAPKTIAPAPDAQHSVTNRPAFGLNVITQFVRENTLSGNCDDSRWEQLRAMWTAHCVYNNLEVDTAAYDAELGLLWSAIYATQRAGAELADCAVDAFQNYDAFNRWICKNLV